MGKLGILIAIAAFLEAVCATSVSVTQTTYLQIEYSVENMICFCWFLYQNMPNRGVGGWRVL